jgi:sulfur-carrier protein
MLPNIKNQLIIMKVKVLFFGVLSEVTGNKTKYYSDVKSLEHLKKRIVDEFPDMIRYKFIISLNNEIMNSNNSLKNGDEVAFLPPFAGG